MKSALNRRLLAAATFPLILLLGLSQPIVALDFVFTKSPSFLALESSDPALAGMIETAAATAATSWESIFFDPVTVTVELDLAALPPGALATGGPATVPIPYTDVKSALIGDAKSIIDADVIGSLQPGPFLEAVVNDTTMTPSLPKRIGSLAPGGAVEEVWNSELLVPTANAKALGLPIGPPPPADGTFTINETLLASFDYDSSDGVGTGLFDFETIAKHEMGHIMGFLSGVDSVDFAGATSTTSGPDNPDDLSGEAVFKVLDLFKYTPGTLMDPFPPSEGSVLAWFYGPEPGAIPPEYVFFSVDGGSSILGFFETGFFNGFTGEQTSHWLEGSPSSADPGIMVADLDLETILAISSLDITAMDAIGWDIVPEPGAAILLMLALGVIPRIRRQ